MPVKDLYYQKYLKYKNKYLNLQSQMGGVNKYTGVDKIRPPLIANTNAYPSKQVKNVSPFPFSDLPDELRSKILESSNYSYRSFNKESKNLKDIQTLNSLNDKLGIDVSNMFTTNENIFIDLNTTKLKNEEIYLLAKIFTKNINLMVTKNIFIDRQNGEIDKIEVALGKVLLLHNLKAILLNPNKKLELTNEHFVFPTYYKEGDDTIIVNLYRHQNIFLDFTLFFIFACIDIMRLNSTINIKLDLSHFGPSEPFKNKKNIDTIIFGLKNLKFIELYINKLYYDHGTIEKYVFNDIVPELVEPLKTNTTLKHLKLSGMISWQGAKALAEVLKINTTLETLNLYESRMYEHNTRYLAEALVENKKTSLNHLKLTNNAVGLIGAQALALALKSENTKLKILELDNADIRNEATELLADALKSNKILEKLVLSYNKISDVGAKALADALELNTTLKTLDLRYCFIKNKDIFKPYLSRVNILI